MLKMNEDLSSDLEPDGGSAVNLKPSLFGTVLLEHSPNTLHDDLVSAIVTDGDCFTIKGNTAKCTHVSKSETLVSFYSYDPAAHVNQLVVADGTNYCRIARSWSHDSHLQSCSSVLIRNLPQECKLYSLLVDVLDVKIHSIQYEEDKNEAMVELIDPSDLPYLITQSPYSYKKQQLEFIDPNDTEIIAVQDIEELPIIPDYDPCIEWVQPYSNHQDMVDTNQNIHYGIKVTFNPNSSLPNANMMELVLRETLKNPLYNLEISEFSLIGNEAVLAFTQPDGVSKVLQNPPDLLGASATFHSIPLNELHSSKQLPSFLIVEGLCISPEAVKDALEISFNNRGYKVADITTTDDLAYIWFKNDEVIMNIVDHPPENSTFLGQPIIYRPGFASDVSSKSAIVLIKNLPENCSQFKTAFIVYLRNVTNGSVITHCDIKGQEAFVKFEDPQVALKLVRIPPKSQFISEIPTFESIQYYEFSLLSELTATELPLKERKPAQTPARNKNSPQPIPRPRVARTKRHRSCLIMNLPKSSKKDTLKNYIEALTKLECTDIMLNPPKAAVFFSKGVDLQSLKSEVQKEKFKNTVLQIEVLQPSLSVLVISSEYIEEFDVEMYCKMINRNSECSNLIKIETQLNNTKFVVTFSSKEECDKFLELTIHQHHSIGNAEIKFTPYHPVLASLEETSDVPPPVPPRRPARLITSPIVSSHSDLEQEAYYTWPTQTIEVESAGLGKYLQHTLDELNRQLIDNKLYAEVVLQADSIQIRPQRHAMRVDKWDEKVSGIYEKHRKGVVVKNFEVDRTSKLGVMEGLQKHAQQHKDFHFDIVGDGAFCVSGCASSVEQATKLVDDIIETVTEKTLEFKKDPREIQYLLKLEKHSFDSLKPPIVFRYDENNPGSLFVTGVKQSLEKFEELANEKIHEIQYEYVMLTKAAYRLLNSHKGKERLSSYELFKNVYYVYLPVSSSNNYQVCLMSSKQSHQHIAHAKHVFEELSREEKIHVFQEKRGILESNEWKKKVEELVTPETFVSIRSTNEGYVVVTGSNNDVPKICEELKVFIESQHEATEDIMIERHVWNVLSNHNQKLKNVKKMAHEIKKIIFTENIKDKDVVITLKGGIEGVEGIKTMLSQMKDEVYKEVVKVESKPGLRKLNEKHLIHSKCQELSKQHNVEIQHEVTDDAVPTEMIREQTPPKRLFTVNADGPIIKFYEGDYTKPDCSAIVAFVSDEPSMKEEVLQSLTRAGGQEVLDDIESSLLYSTDIVPASTKFTKKTGNLKCFGIYYAILSPYSSAGATKSDSALDTVLHEVLDNARIQHNHVLLCPITSSVFHYPPHALAKAIVSSIPVCGMYGNDLTISVYIDDSNDVDKLTEVFRSHRLAIKYHQDKPDHSLKLPVNDKAIHRDSQSLKKVVELIQGSMLDQQVDVYINSTNSNMDFSSGALSRLFKKTCGNSLSKEVSQYITKHGELKYTDVAVTNAPNLKAKKIYHIVLKQKNSSNYVEIFQQTVENVFMTAMKEGHKSIAIPSLGVSGLNYPCDIAASVLFESVASFHAKYPDAITKFLFVVYESKHMKVFEDAYQKLLGFTEQQGKVHVRPVSPTITSKVQHSGNAGFKFEICQGNLVNETSEVIVNSTSVDMQENANKISEAVFGIGGTKLKNACSKLLKDGKTLNNGNLLATTGGNLKCKEVYHVHIPGKASLSSPPSLTETSIMQTAISECLKKAEASKYKSISFPAFNLVAGKYTCQQSGQLMFQCMEKFTQMLPKHLKHARVVIFSQEKYKEFCEYFKQYFAVAGSSTAVLLEHVPGQSTPLPVTRKGARERLVTLVQKPMPQKHVCQKSSVVFHIYGTEQGSVTMAGKDLKRHFKEMFVQRECELIESFDSFQSSDIGEIFEIAHEENVEVEIQRSLKRFLLFGEESAVKIVTSKIEVIQARCQHYTDGLKIYEWLAEESGESDSSGMIKYPDEAMKQIEIAFQKKSQNEIEIFVDGIKATIDLKSMEECDDSGIRRKIHRRQKPKEFDPPAEWCPQPRDQYGKQDILHLPLLSDESSPEYIKATKRFKDTLGTTNYKIISVQRIQNPGEYDRYKTLKQTWESIHMPGKVKEKEVFHGTKQESITPICSRGFNRNFAAEANAAVFGQGVYFALNAQYSAQRKYSPEDNDGVKHILVCSMVVGEYTRGKENMRTAPLLPNNELMTYDTLVNDEANPIIFVALKDAQAYPKYWIKFKLT